MGIQEGQPIREPFTLSKAELNQILGMIPVATVVIYEFDEGIYQGAVAYNNAGGDIKIVGFNSAPKEYLPSFRKQLEGVGKISRLIELNIPATLIDREIDKIYTESENKNQ